MQPDPYPSRVLAEPAWLSRKDPVAHTPWRLDCPLSRKQHEGFERDGYLVIEDLFEPEEIKAMQAELHRLQSLPAELDLSTLIAEPGSGALRSIFAIHEQSLLFARLTCDARLVSKAQHLLGDEVYVHQSRLNYKSGFDGKEFYWHSDFETWHVEDGVPAMRMVSCSVSLTANTPHNGPLMLIPGSHQRFVSCVGATPDNHYKASLRRQEVGVPDDESLTRLVNDFGITAPTGLAGAVTFFECNVMHGSNSNITPLPRSNIFVVYNSVHNTPVAPFCGLAPRPNFIAERQDFTPLSSGASH